MNLFFAFIADRVALVGRYSGDATLVVGVAERGAVFLTFCGRAVAVVFVVVVFVVAATIRGKTSSFLPLPSRSCFSVSPQGFCEVVQVERQVSPSSEQQKR